MKLNSSTKTYCVDGASYLLFRLSARKSTNQRYDQDTLHRDVEQVGINVTIHPHFGLKVTDDFSRAVSVAVVLAVVRSRGVENH